jgi:class 3 adenylate cyclase
LLDVEARRLVADRYFETVSEVLERHGATVERLVDDTVLAVFGVPRVHEDDALRALRAAVELREALAPLERERGVALEIGVGVSTGEVLAAPGAAIRGEPVTSAVALQRGAPAGTVLFAETTRRLVPDATRADAFAVGRGKSAAPIQAWTSCGRPSTAPSTSGRPISSRSSVLQESGRRALPTSSSPPRRTPRFWSGDVSRTARASRIGRWSR